MGRKTFICYADWIDYLQEMWPEEKSEFLETLLNYHNWIEVNPVTWFKFIRPKIKKTLDDNWAHREEISKIKKDAANKRWKQKNAPASKWMHMHPKASTRKQVHYVTDTVTDTDTITDTVTKEEYLINNPEKINLIENFINENQSQIAYQIKIKWRDKYYASQAGELEKLIKDWYNLETIQTVCQFIKQSDFRSKNIMSIKKLREKDKEWIPWMVRMIAEIQRWKPTVIDLDPK